mgnify:CR=1 FL=1
MKPWQVEPEGRFERHTLASRALQGNPLGDPHERPLWVYLPPGVGDEPARRHPSIYLIQGFTGQVDMWWNRSALRPTLPELMDELFTAGGAPPAVVVLVDCWTSYGGSQFLNEHSGGEGWHHFETERSAFLAWLAEKRIGGVLFLSGDRHRTEMHEWKRPGTYPLFDLTCSPLTSRPRTLTRAERANPSLLRDTVVEQRNFCQLAFSGRHHERAVTVRVFDSQGTPLWRRTIRASELR